MREILFRGKAVVTGGWAFGNLVIQETDNSEVNFITNNETVVDVFIQPIKKVWDTHWNSFGRQEWKAVSPMLKVFPDTVGQYTGLTDKHGKKIFEGDIVHMNSKKFCLSGHGVVVYRNGSFAIDDRKRNRLYPFMQNGQYNAGDYRVDGNIHDHKELLHDSKV